MKQSICEAGHVVDRKATGEPGKSQIPDALLSSLCVPAESAGVLWTNLDYSGIFFCFEMCSFFQSVVLAPTRALAGGECL